MAITRQMKELNVNPKMFGLTVGGDLPEFYDLLKQNAEYVYGATQWDDVAAVPGQKEFLAAYKKRVQGHEPSYHARPATRGCLIYAEAVKQAGHARRRQGPRRSSSSWRSRRSFGDYKVDQDGFQIAHKMVMLQWQDGKRVDGVAGRPRQRQAALPDAGLGPAIAR